MDKHFTCMHTVNPAGAIRPHDGGKVGIVCCSNGQPQENRALLKELRHTLETAGLAPVFSPYIYASDSVFSGRAAERAQALMEFYKDPDITAIFDISGGDIANEILPYMDFDVIARNPKLFWGYSDLTTILNAVYTKTGQPAVLYQIRNLVYEHRTAQQKAFFDTVLRRKTSLLEFPYTFVQGTHMEGIVVGGNIRCFLKLAGTEFFPDLQGKLLLLEAWGGGIPQMVTYLSQLKMMGAFEQVSGILLGTFTRLEQDSGISAVTGLVQSYAGGLPVVKTQKIGHGTDSGGIMIGAGRVFDRNSSYMPV